MRTTVPDIYEGMGRDGFFIPESKSKKCKYSTGAMKCCCIIVVSFSLNAFGFYLGYKLGGSDNSESL